jgi:glycine betaine transporter
MATKFGSMKLGLPSDKPEFSSCGRFAMLFGSAIAAGIVSWGSAEPKQIERIGLCLLETE